MSPSNKSLPPTPDRTTDPQHDGYRDTPGPEKYSSGSPEHAEMLGYLDSLRIAEIPNVQKDETGNVRICLYKNTERENRTPDQCPRAVKRIIQGDNGRHLLVALPCKARTCSHCKSLNDERDHARLIHSLDTEIPYLAEMSLSESEALKKRVQRLRKDGDDTAAAIDIPSAAAHDRVVLAMSRPFTKDAQPTTIGTLLQLVIERPPNAPLTELEYENGKIRHRQKGRRRHMTGPGLISVREWESDDGPATKKRAAVVDVNYLVDFLSAATAARAYGLRTQRTPRGLEIRGNWDGPEMGHFLAWAKDPLRLLDWEQTKREIDEAQTARPPLPDEVPMEVYERQLSLSGVAAASSTRSPSMTFSTGSTPIKAF